MSQTKSFYEFLNKFVPLSQQEYDELIVPGIVIRKFDKKEIITNLGEVENYINFIESGLVRKYYTKGKSEINTQISIEGQIIHSQVSFHGRTPSEYIVETVEPTILNSISYDSLEKIYSTSQKMERMGRLVITVTLVLQNKFQSQLVKLSPREMFLNFVTRHPELMQRVPQKYLATFLNIKPETFSRFKHLLKDQSNLMLIPED